MQQERLALDAQQLRAGERHDPAVTRQVDELGQIDGAADDLGAVPLQEVGTQHAVRPAAVGAGAVARHEVDGGVDGDRGRRRRRRGVAPPDRHDVLLEEGDLDGGRRRAERVEEEAQVDVADAARLRQHQLQQVLVPARPAAHNTQHTVRHIHSDLYIHSGLDNHIR